MTTEPQKRTAEAGFTLVEVLVAMVVLAVGLLGLEALGVGAARMVNRAERQHGLVAAASDTLERTLGRIRATPAGTAIPEVQQRFMVAGRDSIRVHVTSPGSRLTTVSVTAIPSPSSSLLRRADSVRITGHVFR